ncbi:MAG: GNAT family N-acetyltransferase [Thaumarchaeota archaeon]|nr:GNAT family N-acetyltransferase [Nitrososphaerota archaeon]
MADSNEAAYEFNEVSWWSKWADTKWLSRNAYLLFSKDFDEYFFNRGGFLKITTDSRKSIAAMEIEFEARKRKPHLLLQSDQLDSKLLVTLAKGGYRIADQMAVMDVDEASFKVNPDLKIEHATGSKLEAWVRIYLDSFYGDSSQLKAVMAIVQRLAKVGEASLLLGTIEDKPAGITALFRSGKVCGAYCVATHRDWRRKRVASTLLEFSHRLASEESRRLVLQTILSDSLEGLYLKLGFRRAYLKDLFVKDAGRMLK